MPDDQLDKLHALFEQGEVLRRRARDAELRLPEARATDLTESVTVTLDGDGRVSAVAVAAGWRRRVDADALGAAVLDAVRDAAARRLTAWGEAYAVDGQATGVPNEAGVPDREGFARRLQEAADGRMSSEDGHAALTELLALAQAVERGLDEVSAQLRSALDATHVGRSPDRSVTVTLTGGGDPVDVHFRQRWLHTNHEVNIGRQTTAAFRAAYQEVARHEVGNLIARSSLGEVQRAVQDPFALARRLRMRD